MKGIAIALLVVGGIGVFAGLNMFGDIGVAALIGSVTAILSGVGFLKASRNMHKPD